MLNPGNKTMYGIIGYPLSHSFSPGYFRESSAIWVSKLLSMPFPLTSITELPGLLEAYPALLGLNVTIPYKQSVIAYLDELDATADAVGAVNCIRIRDGRLKGFNTDTLGFANTLKPLLTAAHEAGVGIGYRRSSQGCCVCVNAIEHSLQHGVAYLRRPAVYEISTIRL